MDKNDKAISGVATYARDTLDFYVQELRGFHANEPYLKKKIVEDQYMVTEVQQMRTTIDLLLKVDILTEKLLKELTAGIMIDLDLLPD